MTSYREAGVDLEAAGRHVARISAAVTSTWGPQVVGAFGGFAAGIRMPAGYREPVLVMTTDGVGTKLELARRSGRWEGVGWDLVAMCVDDLAAAGARPIGLVDYMAVGALDEDRDAAIVASIAGACLEAGVPLLGGETAEHPGVMAPDAVDLAAAALGIAEESETPGPHRARTGDLVVGLHSPNLRSNGFSLVRGLFADDIDDHAAAFLEPSVIYSPTVLRLLEDFGVEVVKAGAHVTGGGIVENLPRALPPGMGARIDTASWVPPDVFAVIADRGVGRMDMFRTFNMGIGFCLIVDPVSVDAVMADAGPASVIGTVVDGSGVELT